MNAHSHHKPLKLLSSAPIPTHKKQLLAINEEEEEEEEAKPESLVIS